MNNNIIQISDSIILKPLNIIKKNIDDCFNNTNIYQINIEDIFNDVIININIENTDLNDIYKKYNEYYFDKCFEKHYINNLKKISIGNSISNSILLNDENMIYIPPKNFNYFIYSDILNNYNIKFYNTITAICNKCIINNISIKNIYLKKIKNKNLELIDEIIYCNNCDNKINFNEDKNYINKSINVFDIYKENINDNFNFFYNLKNPIHNVTLLIVLRNIYIRSVSVFLHFMDKIHDFKKVFFLNKDDNISLKQYNDKFYFNEYFDYNISFYDFLLIINDAKKCDYLYIDYHIDEQIKNLIFLLNFCFKDIKYLLIDEDNNINNDVFKMLNIKRNKEIFNEIICKEHINKNNVEVENNNDNNIFLGKTKYKELKIKNYKYFFNDEIYNLVEEFYSNDILFFKTNNIKNNKLVS